MQVVPSRARCFGLLLRCDIGQLILKLAYAKISDMRRAVGSEDDFNAPGIQELGRAADSPPNLQEPQR